MLFVRLITDPSDHKATHRFDIGHLQFSVRMPLLMLCQDLSIYDLSIYKFY